MVDTVTSPGHKSPLMTSIKYRDNKRKTGKQKVYSDRSRAGRESLKTVEWQ